LLDLHFSKYLAKAPCFQAIYVQRVSLAGRNAELNDGSRKSHYPVHWLSRLALQSAANLTEASYEKLSINLQACCEIKDLDA
jgi:hypothetical protein